VKPFILLEFQMPMHEYGFSGCRVVERGAWELFDKGWKTTSVSIRPGMATTPSVYLLLAERAREDSEEISPAFLNNVYLQMKGEGTKPCT
jgi:hypothetical protein